MKEFDIGVYNDRSHCIDKLGYVGSRTCLDDISVVVADIISLEVDAIVNAANEGLRTGGECAVLSLTQLGCATCR